MSRAVVVIDGTHYLAARDTAAVMGITTGTLANWRAEGGGPPHEKVSGRTLYPLEGLIEWSRLRAARLEAEVRRTPITVTAGTAPATV